MEYVFITIVFLAEIIVCTSIVRFLHNSTLKVKALNALVKEGSATIYDVSRQIRVELKKYNLKIKKFTQYHNIINIETILSITNTLTTFWLMRKLKSKKFS